VTGVTRPDAGQQVGTPRLHLRGVAGAFQPGLHRQPGAFQCGRDVAGLQETEVDVDCCPHHSSVPYSEPRWNETRPATRAEHAVHLGEGARQLTGFQMDDRVESHYSPELAVASGQVEQIPTAKSAPGCSFSAIAIMALDRSMPTAAHRERQPAGHVTWAAAEVGNGAPCAVCSMRLASRAGPVACRPVPRKLSA